MDGTTQGTGGAISELKMTIRDILVQLVVLFLPNYIFGNAILESLTGVHPRNSENFLLMLPYIPIVITALQISSLMESKKSNTKNMGVVISWYVITIFDLFYSMRFLFLIITSMTPMKCLFAEIIFTSIVMIIAFRKITDEDTHFIQRLFSASHISNRGGILPSSMSTIGSST
jgi:hypothetical protein